jgi:hypothetical protein
MWIKQTENFLFMLFYSPPNTPSFLGPNILFGTLFSNTMYVITVARVMQFHIYVKQQVKVQFCGFWFVW